MDNELDINKIVAEFVQANIESAWDLAKSRAKGLKTFVRARFESTYTEYLTKIGERYSRSKSFFVRTEPLPLYRFFVPLDLATQIRTLNQPTASDITSISPFSIIIGTGGSGKTMMMRHLLLSGLKAHMKTPIFLELRQLNQRNEPIISALLRNLQTNGLDIDEDYLTVALSAGHFFIMLDGFDELLHTLRKQVAQDVVDLAERYSKNWILMSSRPDPELEGWTSFTQYKVQPLDLDRAVELVEKLPFDDPIKERFEEDLKSELFEKHRSFLANPLLLSIMLLTYSDVAHIPNKLSIFYNQAFDSLFHKHDALKGGFQRERKSNLDIQDFSRAFAAFCIQSYDKREFTFTRLRALELFDNAKKLTNLDYSSQDILDDSLQAVCLLVDEGMDVAFAHRSFQEYFAARFINSCTDTTKPLLIKRFAQSEFSGVVMALLYEMDSHIVDLHYILPAFENLTRRILLVRSIGITHYLRYIKLMYGQFSTMEDDQKLYASINDMALFHALRFAERRYLHFYENLDKQVNNQYSEKIRKVFKEEVGSAVNISTKSLTAKSPFLKILYDSPGGWGGDYLRQLLSIEAVIRQKHLEAQSSLNEFLSSKQK